MEYIKSPNAKELYSNNQVLLCNIKTGGYLKTNKVYFEYLNFLMEEHKGEIEWATIADEEIMNNVKFLLSQLLKIKYVICKDDFRKEMLENYEVIYLSITNNCNLRCKHCSVSSGTEASKDLSLEEWKYIIDQVIQLKPSNIEVTGGEPLLYDDFQSFIKYLRKRYNGNISLSTNSLLIDEQNIIMIKQNIDSISISMDGYDEDSCSKIRGKGIFDNVVGKILFLQKNGITNISASMLITSFTEMNKEKFANLCSNLGITPIYRRFSPSGRGSENYAKLVPKTTVFQNIDTQFLRCALCKPGKRELNISSNGHIYPCAPLSSAAEFNMGNCLNESISDIIRNEVVEKLIEQKRPWNTKKCRECNVNIFCHSCINYILSIQQDPQIFEEICEQNKLLLTKAIWE